MNLKSWVRTAIISICSMIPTAGISLPKRGIDASAGSRLNSDESQNLKELALFLGILENKSGKRIYRKTIPLVRVMQALKKKKIGR